MSQPPDQPAPDDRPWQDPGLPPAQPPYGSTPPPDPYGAPPPTPPGYGGTYGRPFPPEQGGGAYGYQAPMAELASRWARLGAAIIDGLILAVIGLVISLPFVSWHRLTQLKQRELISPEQYKLNLIALIIGLLYFWLLTYGWSGQTVGKRLLRIRVVRAADGGPISNGQALIRALVYAVAGNVCGCFGLLDVLWILWDRRKQCLHDKAATTVVIKADPGMPDPYATTKR